MIMRMLEIFLSIQAICALLGMVFSPFLLALTDDKCEYDIYNPPSDE